MLDALSEHIQREREEKYSKRAIKQIVLDDLAEVTDAYLFQGVNLLHEYIEGREEPRIQALIGLDLAELINEVFYIVLTQPEISVQSAVGRLRSHLGYDPDKADVYQYMDSLDTSTEVLGVLMELGLYTRRTTLGSVMLVSKVAIEEATREYIQETMYLPPMVSMPYEVTSNASTGYIYSNGSLLLNNHHHDNDICLDAINILTAIPLELDEVSIQEEEQLKDSDKELTMSQETERTSNFFKQRTISDQVEKDIVSMGNKFWFNWKYCSRGRIYSQGYHVNLQGPEYKKSCINFHNKQLVEISE